MQQNKYIKYTFCKVTDFSSVSMPIGVSQKILKKIKITGSPTYLNFLFVELLFHLKLSMTEFWVSN